MFFSSSGVTESGEVGGGEYLLYRVMLQNSACAYFLTDHTKRCRTMPNTICDFSDLAGVISDFEFSKETRERYPNTAFITV